ncbi:MAG: fumarate reductase/succinate dehydrogenase flavoprotein subunit, partial [Phaeodactylibacter sp.]|nr:fumarate reductase/succinate dehydrogenase flavoprotein subunit [Phaeodactylibacter sp.]
MKLDAKIPEGPLQEKWSRYKATCRLVSPNNKKKLDIIVVGTGLAGSSAAASLAEMGYRVKTFCFQDSPRRAHSVAAQGGVNASKNYQNDGDSAFRMFYDTLKGGDFRAREANVYRLAECSANLIDQAVAQGVPFAREYGGYLANRSFGGVQVSRTFYARGQTGQQLLLGAYSALSRQVAEGNVQLFARHEMLDLVVIDGKARGIIARNLDTGEIERHAAHTVVLATGGYGKIYYLSTLAMGCNGSAIWRAHKKGAGFAAASWTQIHPTCLPQSGAYQSKLTLMSESLRNDGRIWVPKKAGDDRPPGEIPEEERDYYLERRYPAFGNLAPRDIASRAAKERIDAGFGVGPQRNAVYLDFAHAIEEYGIDTIRERYGNLFRMYEKITGHNAYKRPMMISPAAHFSMGGLWVDYELMTTIPGLFAIGECNFSDHGANRLGANSLLQACVDGYFILPYTIGSYLAGELGTGKISPEAPEFDDAEQAVRDQLARLLSIQGSRTATDYHKELGALLYDKCGVLRTREGLQQAIDDIRALRADFWQNLKVPGSAAQVNSELEKAGRVADYLELAEVMCYDALTREESCGAHFREEYQTAEGE